ncbi:YceI family protein [Marinicella sp. W31]|uniref:YceI family protein n=1 Tax=Marinicella sp. W31 TaxID=3023713 RepID=UPI003757539F
MKNLIYLLTFQTALMTAPHVMAEKAFWTLASNNSMVSFISTKNKDIREEHSFKEINGFIQQSGTAVVVISLDSVETNIEIRNERMREHVFGSDAPAMATISTTLDQSQLQSGQTKIKVNLEMNGHNKEYLSEVTVDHQNDRLIVTSFNPIEVNAKDFAYDDGINTMTSLAQLQSISYIVPVEFKLEFMKKH